jgi:branched-subunit amino acid ABC-type transport system permease component
MLEQQIINGLMLGSVYVLVAVAFTLTIGVLNFLNFSLPAIFMLGGMFTWALLSHGVHWLATLLIALRLDQRTLSLPTGNTHSLQVLKGSGLQCFFVILVCHGSSPIILLPLEHPVHVPGSLRTLCLGW